MKTDSLKNKKILICGDSISKGITFDMQKKRYVFLKNSVEKQIVSEIPMDIDNVSKFGNTVEKGYKAFIKAFDKKDYDIVIIGLGGNDCDFNWKAVANHPECEHNPNTEYSKYKTTLKDMIKQARQRGARPVLVTLPPIDAQKYFDWISSFAQDAKDRILQWLGSVNKIYWWQEHYNAALLNVANEMKCDILDIRSALLGTSDYRKYYCVDGIHPNENGHSIMAKAIMASIVSR